MQESQGNKKLGLEEVLQSLRDDPGSNLVCYHVTRHVFIVVENLQ